MKDETDIQPPVNPNKNASETDKDSSEKLAMKDNDDSTFSTTSIPLYEELCATPPKKATAQEIAQNYGDYLQNAPGFPWQPDEETIGATPTFEAPFLTDNPSASVTREQLITGIFINVPRSPKLWVGDQLKMRWGYNTFYTTVTESTGRSGARLTQYLNSEGLANYASGELEVRYEVVRRSRLVGVSETLKVTVQGDNEGPPRANHRGRTIRRRKLNL